MTGMAARPVTGTAARPDVFDRQAVRDLYDEYAYLLDSGDHDGWLALFTEDCEYRVVARENHERGLPLATMRADSRAMLADRLYAIANLQMTAPRVVRHFVSGARLLGPAPGGEGAAAGANFLVTETLDDEPTTVHAAGRYVDVVVAGAEGLQFASKVAVYDSAMVTTSMVHPL